MEKKSGNIEKMNNQGWLTDIVLLVNVTDHLSTFNKELQCKCKLITDMYDKIKAFKFKLRLSENQLKLHNHVHFPQLKYPDVHYPERIQNYSQPILLL
jgi:hypothetical protein